MSVSPNPATDLISIKLYGFSGNVLLQLTDLQSRVLQKAQLKATAEDAAQQQFRVAHIASGTYIIVAEDEHGNRKTEKVIVSH